MGAWIRADTVRRQADWLSHASQQELYYTCASESHKDSSRLMPPVDPPSEPCPGLERFEYPCLLRLEEFHILTDPALQPSTLTEIVQVHLRVRQSLVTEFHAHAICLGVPTSAGSSPASVATPASDLWFSRAQRRQMRCLSRPASFPWLASRRAPSRGPRVHKRGR